MHTRLRKIRSRISKKSCYLTLILVLPKLVTAEETASQPFETTRAFVQTVYEKTVYGGMGTALGAAALLAKMGWCVSLTSPLASTLGEEVLLLSNICKSASAQMFKHLLQKPPSPLLKGIPYSQSSWHLNQRELSKIPTSSDEERNLLQFLERRWLAKSTGFFSAVVDWICPSFGISLQVHPETTSHYARNPWNKLSQTYINRVAAWKSSLPQPRHFPLILTRPFDLRDYLPHYIAVSQDEPVATTVSKISTKAVIDLTEFIPGNLEPEKWLQAWDAYQAQLSQACQDQHLNLKKIICIQRVKLDAIGGIRILPWKSSSTKMNERHYRFLLKWISTFGLAANFIELDRDSCLVKKGDFSEQIKIRKKSNELPTFSCPHPQKRLMLEATIQLLNGLPIPQATLSLTEDAVVQLSLSRIQEQLDLLANEKAEVSFFDALSHIEQIQANLSSLLEVISPFTADDFPPIYLSCLTCIPPRLKKLTACTIHSSGMTTITGIFKSLEKMLGRVPHVLYGENTYFECIKATQQLSKATCWLNATPEDWVNVDLILAQFNPALKRIELQATDYKVEKIAEVLRRALNARNGKLLTLALDCTLDYIDSPRVAQLLGEFQQEIEAGFLNIICYRSGTKFDLFGMDNYCGAPLFMIHSRDLKWGFFDRLLTDPVLQTDPLSLNWFCLAYQNAAPMLELYRKQIFDNTRAFLNKIPSRLFYPTSHYRIIPMEEETDAAFVDIKISGLFHQIRGAALVGGYLSIKCMGGGHPIFYRPSLGFYHPNFTMIFGKDSTTMRFSRKSMFYLITM